MRLKRLRRRSRRFFRTTQIPSRPTIHLTLLRENFRPQRPDSMSYDLRVIYARTDGYCHICHAKVYFTNYGQVGARGAWEVEHSRAQIRGGSHHGNNLRPACISCNRSKGAMTTRAARVRHGHTRSPLSKAAKAKIRKENTATGAAIGTVFGAGGGPVGMIIGGVAGAWIGRNLFKPPKV